jgi:hypothetical protein
LALVESLKKFEIDSIRQDSPDFLDFCEKFKLEQDAALRKDIVAHFISEQIREWEYFERLVESFYQKMEKIVVVKSFDLDLDEENEERRAE